VNNHRIEESRIITNLSQLSYFATQMLAFMNSFLTKMNGLITIIIWALMLWFGITDVMEDHKKAQSVQQLL